MGTDYDSFSNQQPTDDDRFLFARSGTDYNARWQDIRDALESDDLTITGTWDFDELQGDLLRLPHTSEPSVSGDDAVMWVSDGTNYGEGDLMVKIGRSGIGTKTVTLVDWSNA